VKAARTVAAAAGALLALWIAAISGPRVVALVRGQAPRDAVGEDRFYGFSYRDPALVGRLEEIGQRLPTGFAVLPVCGPECETGWYSFMTAYALPRQAVVGAKTEGQLGAVFPTRIIRTRNEARVGPRSESDGRP
jgi:hypothetical protein